MSLNIIEDLANDLGGTGTLAGHFGKGDSTLKQLSITNPNSSGERTAEISPIATGETGNQEANMSADEPKVKVRKARAVNY